MSGLVFGLVYARRIAQQGVGWGVKTLTRCWQLYAANLIAFVLTMAVIGLLRTTLAPDLASASFGLFFDQPEAGFAAMASMGFVWHLFGILPTYVVILLMTLPLLLVMRRNPDAGLALSLLLYVATQFAPATLNLPTVVEGRG